ncbi:YdcF family protein [Sporosarcina siberiensis]|uniref:YdcF family protein n=1 Tax=Sporosarcina siberiensis TaxID=1365606 RepID=A0ABW4SGW5_9BACL
MKKKNAGKKIIMIVIIIVVICVISLWMLTGKWIKDGIKIEADGTNEYAIILGAKVNGDTPSLSLRYRLDAALDYGNKYSHVLFILSGGQGPDENTTEAEAMKRFLVANGIGEERLILETKSTSTYENILLSKELLPEKITSVTIITSDYHIARTKFIARKLGLDTDSVAGKTPGVVELKLNTRERLALIKTYIVGK